MKYAIIVAGGSGSRMNSEVPKQFLPLNGKPVLVYTLEAFAAAGGIEVILVLPDSQRSAWQEIVAETAFGFPHRIVSGGKTRFHSVKNGLDAIPGHATLVAVHDGVRPLITPELINRCFAEAAVYGSAITAVPLKDSLRRVDEKALSAPTDREAFRLVQTPQTFRTDWMKTAFQSEYQPFYTDCASVVEHAGFPIHLTEGDYKNLKITTPDDLVVAGALLSSAGPR